MLAFLFPYFVKPKANFRVDARYSVVLQTQQNITTAQTMIRHILLIKFKTSATSDKIQQLRELFEAMPTKVEGVTDVEWGLNNSPEGKNKDYTHAVMMTFADEAGRQNYLPHPEHDALKEVFRPLLEDIIVFDYEI